MKSFFIITIFFLFVMEQPLSAQKPRIIVDKSGKGNFKTIQGAINSIANSSNSPRVIYIRNGVYKEKIYIEKHHIILQGESREKTIITQAISRDEWRCGHLDDWGVATINIDGDDITLQNLTIINSFGFDWKIDKKIPCASDTGSQQKTITRNGHQMALRTLNGNRLRAINCHFKAFGGDTVSPWNVQNGMFYFKNCIMEGGVDFYCPRGWAWAENCHFISHSGSAAIWHDGSKNRDSKTVLKNCTFQGFDGFNLGRYHWDAQFYLINCSFPQNMSDKDIYLVPTTNIIKWGRRIYYYNTHKKGGDYSWHKNNLHTASGAPNVEDITVDWLFDGRWKPHLTVMQSLMPVAHARLSKRNAFGMYGNALQQETAPPALKPNNFTTTPIPYYQTEGPTWENDKIGFRLYLDVRNAKDIFGKTTPSMLMDTVGTFGDKYYHALDPSWGMDVLKVGNSLGAGSLAIQIKTVTGSDTIIRLGGEEIASTTYELIKDGLNEAIIRLHYTNWKVLDRTYNLTEEISIKGGTYYYESRVTMQGLRGDESLVTGMVNLKADSMYTTSSNTADVLYTHAPQSENNDYLGMAIITPKNKFVRYLSLPNSGNGVTNTYAVSLPVKNNTPISFRFYAGWEKTNPEFRNKENFRKFLKEEAQNWQYNLKKIKRPI